MSDTAPAYLPPQPSYGAPVRRPVNRWNVASLLTLIGGHVVVALGGVIFAAVIVFSSPVTGDQAGWNILAFVLMPFSALVSGFVGIFALAGLVLAIVGIRKRGRSAFGIVMIVVCAVFSIQLVSLVLYLAQLPSLFENGYMAY